MGEGLRESLIYVWSSWERLMPYCYWEERNEKISQNICIIQVDIYELEHNTNWWT